MRIARFVPSALVLALAGSNALATAATPAPSPHAPQLRLPTMVKPIRYAARLTVRPTETSFAGAIDIDVTVDKATDILWLNGTGLKVTRATFQLGGKTTVARPVAGGGDFIGLTIGRPLPPGPLALHIEYQGQISRTDDRGLFAQKEGDRWYAISQFEPIFARRVFPCFDEPSYKVPWQLTLEVPEGETALSNTHATGEKREHGGMKTVSFAPTPPLPSYLVAFAVGPYEVIDAGKAGMKATPLRVAVPAGRGKDAQYAVKVSGKLVELLEQYFGSPFPYEKLDVVTIPIASDFGAMENPGMVTAVQSLVVAPPNDQGIRFQRNYAETNAHEFAHQWFGDLVTTAWWDDIWLNESFANWLQTKVIDQWQPNWAHGTGTVDSRDRALSVDVLVTARRIRQPIVTDDDINNIFDPITYEKGESLLSMVEHFVGAAAFQRGIRQYIAAHANGNADADQFIAAIGAAAGRDLGPAFRSFLNQPGAPLVDVALSCAGKPTLTLKQQRFLPVGSKGSTNQKWQIPLCVRYLADGKMQRTCSMLTEAEETLPLETNRCPTWLLANDESVGYYRAAYSGKLLEQLLSSDGRKRLAYHELLGLLADVDALVEAGRLDYSDVLALVPSLAQDPRRKVASVGVGLLGGLRDHLVDPSLQPAYARLVRKSFGTRAHQLGWATRPGDDEDTRLLRPVVLGLVADEGEDQALRTEAQALAQRWLADHAALSPEVVDAVLRTAAQQGDEKLFNQLLTALQGAHDRQDRRHLIAALASFRDPKIVSRALPITLGNDVDVRESMFILFGAAHQHETRQLAWDFLRHNWEALLKRLPEDMSAETPSLGIGFCDDMHRHELQDFFKDRSPKLSGGPRLFAQAVEASELCQAFIARQQPNVSAYLRRW
jgi:alanyl aminopeptidase